MKIFTLIKLKIYLFFEKFQNFPQILNRFVEEKNTHMKVRYERTQHSTEALFDLKSHNEMNEWANLRYQERSFEKQQMKNMKRNTLSNRI